MRGLGCPILMGWLDWSRLLESAMLPSGVEAKSG